MVNDRIRRKPKRGRPPSPDSKRARIELRTQAIVKEQARSNLPALNFPDLTAYLEHCLSLLASGAAHTIRELHAPNDKTPSQNISHPTRASHDLDEL
jgi:hypothetical protein